MKNTNHKKVVNEKLGRKIRWWRKHRGMTVDAFLFAIAKHNGGSNIGATRQSVHNWEKGLVDLSLPKLKVIARALRIKIERLI